MKDNYKLNDHFYLIDNIIYYTYAEYWNGNCNYVGVYCQNYYLVLIRDMGDLGLNEFHGVENYSNLQIP